MNNPLFSGVFKNSDRVVICCLVLFASIFNSNYARAQSYFVEGEISFKSESAGSLQKRTAFNVKVEGCKWSIEVFHPDPEKSGIRLFRQSFDGKNLLALTLFTASVSERGKNDSGGSIEFSSVPNDRTLSHIGSVWLAYASHCYFQNLKMSRVEPIWYVSIKDRTNHSSLPARFVLSEGSPPVPDKLEYFDEGFYRFLSEKSQQMEPKKRTAPFNSGFLTADYNVVTWTNYDKLRVPATFEYHYYNPKTNGITTNDIQRVFTMQGKLLSIKSIDAASDIANIIPKVSVVEDYRIAAVEPKLKSIQYTITNGEIPETNALTKMTVFRQAIEKADLARRLQKQ